MGLKFILLILVLKLNFFIIHPQSGINFKHNSISKAFKKLGKLDTTLIEEIVLPDSVVVRYRISGKFFLVKDNPIYPYCYLYVGRVKSCRVGGCSISLVNLGNDHSEYFDYFILFDNAQKVNLIKVFNYQATHGQEITAKGWLAQFIGFDGNEQLEVGKNIDAISGATISVNAITADVEMKTSLLKMILKQ